MSWNFRCSETKQLIWLKVTIVCSYVLKSYMIMSRTFLSGLYIIDTHRQKLSNSNFVLNMKKMFRTKILEIEVLLSLFDFIRIEYHCNWTEVLRNEC